MPSGARQGWLIATGVMLALCLFAVWQSSLLALTDKLGPGPGFFPFWLSLIGSAFSLVLLIGVIRAPADPPDAEPILPHGYGARRIGAIIGTLAVTTLLMEVLGFQLAMLGFNIVLLVALGERVCGAQDEGEAEGHVENPLAHDRSVQPAPGPRRCGASRPSVDPGDLDLRPPGQPLDALPAHLDLWRGLRIGAALVADAVLRADDGGRFLERVERGLAREHHPAVAAVGGRHLLEVALHVPRRRDPRGRAAHRSARAAGLDQDDQRYHQRLAERLLRLGEARGGPLEVHQADVDERAAFGRAPAERPARVEDGVERVVLARGRDRLQPGLGLGEPRLAEIS